MDDKVLPNPDSPEFPAALKAAREAKGMSRAELARKAGLHSVMPRRYEEPDCGEFAIPREDTYRKLNRALGFAAPSDDDIPLVEATLEQIAEELRERGIQPTFTFPASAPKGEHRG